MVKKIFLSVLMVLMLVSLVGCAKHYCDYCGAEASWKAQVYILGVEPDKDSIVYVCADCKRIGREPYCYSGNTVKWTHLSNNSNYNDLPYICYV